MARLWYAVEALTSNVTQGLDDACGQWGLWLHLDNTSRRIMELFIECVYPILSRIDGGGNVD